MHYYDAGNGKNNNLISISTKLTILSHFNKILENIFQVTSIHYYFFKIYSFITNVFENYENVFSFFFR